MTNKPGGSSWDRLMGGLNTLYQEMIKRGGFRSLLSGASVNVGVPRRCTFGGYYRTVRPANDSNECSELCHVTKR